MGILVLVGVIIVTARQRDRAYWRSLNSREVLLTPPFLAVDGIVLLVGFILGLFVNWGIFFFL